MPPIVEAHRRSDARHVTTALRQVVADQGGISRVAHGTGLGRTHLYRALSSAGQPRLDTLLALCEALDLTLTLTPNRKPTLED